VTSSGIFNPWTQSTTPALPRISEGIVIIFPTPVSYAVAWELQSRIHAERSLDLRPDTLLVLEHQPVYTLGRRTQESHWGGDEGKLRAGGTELHRVNRGGSVTYHGPGQVLLYPILKLARYSAGPRHFVRLLEEVAIRVLNLWEIAGHRIEKRPGVWVTAPGPAKIAAVGVRVERGITSHGLALNVDMDLTPFHRIHPCGLADCSVTSMAALRNSALLVDVVKRDLARVFGAVFGTDWPTFIVEDRQLQQPAVPDTTARTRSS
jgi:lipoyl(octanoyl) transferase